MLWMVTSIFVLAGMLQLHEATVDYYSATANLIGLVHSEQTIVNMIQSYVAGAEENIEFLKRYLQEQYIINNAVPDVMQHVTNPINAYQLVKRMTVGLNVVENAMSVVQGIDLRNTIETMRNYNRFPMPDDLTGAAEALIRLQDTYNLNVSAMVYGLFKRGSPLPSSLNLNARDCIFLGRHAFEQRLYDLAREWFEMAIQKFEVERDYTANIEEVENLLRASISARDELIKRDEVYNEDSVNVRIDNYGTMQADFRPVLYNTSLPLNVEKEQFNRLCRGEQMRPTERDSHLRCRLFAGHHPYLLLQPVRLEEKSLQPFIVVLHDVLREEEMARFIQLAQPHLKRSSHFGTTGFKQSSLRTSSNAWLSDSSDPIIDRINSKIQMMTGLGVNMEDDEAEAYQVANYGIGGHYVPHKDFLQDNFDKLPVNELSPFYLRAGDRLATVMFYLSDVDEGGATAFPYVGVTLWPKKGSAAFWWNLKSNGQGDPLTRHGACPVLFGTKWIANKWVRVNAQTFRKPCHLDRYARFRTL